LLGTAETEGALETDGMFVVSIALLDNAAPPGDRSGGESLLLVSVDSSGDGSGGDDSLLLVSVGATSIFSRLELPTSFASSNNRRGVCISFGLSFNRRFASTVSPDLALSSSLRLTIRLKCLNPTRSENS